MFVTNTIIMIIKYIVIISTIIISTIIIIAECKYEIEYYEKLINESIEKSQNYKIPKDNSLYFKNLNGEDEALYGDFDFIIVGAGATGGTLATRLSENKNWKILLLEAGGEENDFTDIPGMAQNSQFSEKNWGYYTSPQTTCCQGMKNKKCFYARGKSLGGSSTINFLAYTRGNKHDYDMWEEMGNHGWSYKDVLPYFIKSENSQIPDGEPEYHGTGGFLNVAYAVPYAETFRNFVAANTDLGLTELDYNGKQQISVSQFQSNIKFGRRQSIGRALLDKNRNRSNLNITINAFVTKIIVERKTARRVQFVTNGQRFFARAKKAVVLSAGAVNTPQLLMLSGIGPKKELSKHNISVIADLPVGKRLNDHVIFQDLTFRTNHTNPSISLKENIKMYLHGRGPLTIAANCEGFSVINLNDTKSEKPNVEFVFIPSVEYTKDYARAFNVEKNISDYFIKTINSKTDFKIFVMILHPESEGEITLKSSDPRDFPNIDVKYYANQRDLSTHYEGIQFILKLIKTKPFQKIKTEILPLPGCNEYKKETRDYWFCLLKQTSTPGYHPSGTARMGKFTNTSVVNSELLVHGFDNLYIADASVFPSTLSGHYYAPCVMIGEKLADQIKKRYTF